MLREKSKWLIHEDERTDARHWGGPTRTSVEGPVMGLEQRGWVRPLKIVVQLKFFQEEIASSAKPLVDRNDGCVCLMGAV